MGINLSNGQQVKLRMHGSDKIQQGVVHGDSPGSQYIEIKSHIPFKINVNNDLTNLYQIII